MAVTLLGQLRTFGYLSHKHKGLRFGLRISPLYVCIRVANTGETVDLYILAWAFAAQHFDKWLL